MGNHLNKVYAAGPPETAAQNLTAPPLQVPSPASPAGSASPSSDTTPAKSDSDNNPGTYEELHRKCKELFPQTFEGGKFIVSKPLTSHFQISHTINMSMLQPSTSGYRFGATYIGSKQYGPQEAYPVILGDVDPSGNLNANIIHAFTERIRSKLVTQFQDSKCSAYQLTTDYKGNDFTASVTLGNNDILNHSGVIVGQYLQNITSRFAAGAELVYQYGGQVPGGEFAILSAATKITGNSWSLTANVCPSMLALHASYYHLINEQLQIGGELEISPANKETVARACYQMEIPSANVNFKGSLDTNWVVEGCLEKKLLPMPFTFALSGSANFINSQKPTYKFGVGLILG
ncbi:hypothetical protein FSP39_012496 [Pinctada imbricata]|uniref:Uncharacterized protein n=1 Tax=Pinctada imbricata TaxID=66713 RepID=A0AA89BPS8_PINIB|nr:hypothetical protein FSP39_012496 [Pinctada imbricata]